jgi:integrase
MTRTIRAADRNAAESALLDFRRELRDEGVPESDPLVRELAAEWLGAVSTRVKERTATRYRQLLDHTLVVVGGMRVRAVKPGDCQRVLDRMTSSPRTKLHVYRVASEMFGEAVGWGVLQTNPWTLVRAPRPERTQLRIPTVEQTKTILEALRGSIAEGPAMLAAGCGLRLGEAIALRWADADLEHGRIRVTATMYQDGRTEPKSARSRRTVALPIFVAHYLRAHKAGQAERRLRSVAWAEADYVFDRGGGVPMLLLSVSHRFSKCADAIGLGDVRFHDLRHAYATRLLEGGCTQRSSPKRWATPRSRSLWTPTATSCRACRRWRPTPSTRYSASRSAATWRQRERLRRAAQGRSRC